ncbi:MAG: hypothetical protein ACFCUN_12885, partial [Hyphomicrobiaceae bacterium]
LLYDEGYTIKGVQKLLKSRRAKDEPDLPDVGGEESGLDEVQAQALRRLRRDLQSLRDALRSAAG